MGNISRRWFAGRGRPVKRDAGRRESGGLRAGEQTVTLEVYDRVLDLPNIDTLF
jgi:hypothetical protein